MGGGSVAQGGARARDEERGDEAAADRDRVVSHGVHALDGCAASARRCMRYSIAFASSAAGDELRATDDSTLPGRDLGEHLVDRWLLHLTPINVHIHGSGANHREFAPAGRSTSTSRIPLPQCKPFSNAGTSTPSGSPPPATVHHTITERLDALGAHEGTDLLLHGADSPDHRDGAATPSTTPGTRSTPTRAHRQAGRLIVLLAPPDVNPHAAAARAGLENLSRTLSIEWARHRIRAVTVHGNGDAQRDGRGRRLPRRPRGRLLLRLRDHPSPAHGTSTEFSVGESRATTYSAGSVSERLTTTWVWRGGT